MKLKHSFHSNNCGITFKKKFKIIMLSCKAKKGVSDYYKLAEADTLQSSIEVFGGLSFIHLVVLLETLSSWKAIDWTVITWNHILW